MNVLFVGLGGIGQRHLRNLKFLLGNNLKIYALRQRKLQIVLDNKLNVKEGIDLDEYYDINVVNSLEEAFKNKIHIVFITNPSSMHMEVLSEVINNKCSIFIEKPLSDSIDNIDIILKKAKNNKNITFVGYQNRFHPCIKEAKRLLSSNSIGDIISVDIEIGENIKKWHPYEDYRNMYASRKALGGGVVLSQIHELDYINYFFGMPISVYSIGGKLSDLEMDVEDTASTLLSYKINNKIIPVYVHQDYIQSPPCRRCKIIGVKGKIEFDLLKSNFLLYDDSGNEVYNKNFVFERNDMFVEELQLFLKAINSNRTSEIPIEEGVKSLKIALAIKESMNTGKVIFLK